MSRTPLSIVREAKDFLTSNNRNNRRHSYGGFRRFSSQPSLATVDLLPHSDRDLAWLNKGAPPTVKPKRLPSLSNVTQAGKRPPSPPVCNKSPKDLRRERRAGSVPALTPPGAAVGQQSFRQSYASGIETCFSAATEACRSPLTPLSGRSEKRHVDRGFAARDLQEDTLTDVSPTAAQVDSARKSPASVSSRSQRVAPPVRQRTPLLVYRPNGDGHLPDWLMFPKPLEVDSDGDEAHEFWEEDPFTGALQMQWSDKSEIESVDELS